tara:strand:- start:957 stop:2747 length:1791 start_codon:yes stop_codon:yes gene_type:complete
MTEQLYNIAKDQNETSNGLLNDIRRRSSLNRMYEKQSLVLKKKLVEERKKAYDAASRKEGEGKGGLGFLRDLFILRFLRGRGRGGGGFGRGGGRPPVGPRGGLGVSPRITPRNNIVPFSRGRVPTRLGGLSRVGPLAVLGTGLDFTSRLGSGQNVLQASLGAGGGLAGALAGGAKGAALGSFAGPIGTLIGGIGGSILGGFAGGSIADLLSGANRRRGQELERVTKISKKTEFSKALDDFDVVLDKFEGNTASMLKSMNDEVEEEIPGELPTIPKTPFWTKGKITGTVLLGAALLVTALAVLSPFEGVGGDIFGIGLITKALAKLGIKKTAPKILIKTGVKTKKPFFNWQSLFQKKKIFTPRTTPVTTKTPVKTYSRPIETPIKTNTRFPTSSSVNSPTVNPSRNISTNIQGGKSILKNIKKGKNPWDVDLKKIELDPKSPFIRSQVERETGTYIKPFTPSPPSKLIQGSPTIFPTGKASEPLRKIIKKLSKEKPELFQTQIPKPKQEGGRVEVGRPYIVGEVGKELFVPDASGKIIPNDDLPSSNLLVINKEPETVVVPQVTGSGGSSDTPIASNTVNAYDVVAKYAQMTGLFTV